ncbi:HEPN-associated N-terminal domain-containing protein [Candidatus Ruminimicrobium bovinum]|uniref:HEPN-associated N-terminal domain-containing protein n=1 Tax=Candidatus Ruminimicrobium bovinum TaxID=3242779 RepID=UPI0039B9D008
MKYICDKCVNDEGLKSFIKDKKQKNGIKCSNCDNTENVITINSLLEYIKECIANEYDETTKDKYHDDKLKEDINSLPIEILLKYELPKDEKLHTKIINFIGNDKRYRHNNFINNKEYKKILDIWEDFCYEVKYKNRYFFNREILKSLKKIIKLYKPFDFVKKGKDFYRGRTKQLSEEYKIPFKCVSDLCVPPILKISEQRYNAKFISAFYVSDNKKIIFNEIDDISSKSITIVRFKNTKILKIFNLFSRDISLPSLFSKNSKDRAYSQILNKILQEISFPASLDKKEYIFPQIFAEFLRQEFNIDGICYISTVSNEQKGFNYVFFCGRENFKGTIETTNKKDNNIWFEMVSNSIELYFKGYRKYNYLKNINKKIQP